MSRTALDFNRGEMEHDRMSRFSSLSLPLTASVMAKRERETHLWNRSRAPGGSRGFSGVSCIFWILFFFFFFLFSPPPVVARDTSTAAFHQRETAARNVYFTGGRNFQPVPNWISRRNVRTLPRATTAKSTEATRTRRRRRRRRV